jgi:hypothetical protein
VLLDFLIASIIETTCIPSSPEIYGNPLDSIDEKKDLISSV